MKKGPRCKLTGSVAWAVLSGFGTMILSVIAAGPN